MENFWKKCSACKKPIPYKSKYYICSVSTCQGDRTGYVFCSVLCWDSHVPGARHRDAGALERISPAQGAPEAGVRRIVQSASPTTSQSQSSAIPRDVLIVASKLKDYIRARSDMNTSGSVMDTLSDQVRKLCDNAIERARADGRKTVMDRDFEEN